MYTQVELDQAVRNVKDEHGYLRSNGMVDNKQIREQMLGVLSPGIVHSLEERTTKAVTQEDLVAALFPDFPRNDSIEDPEERALNRAVRIALEKDLWNMTQYSAKSPMQADVGRKLGNGYVLCRTELSNHVNAVYVTDDYACIKRDFVDADDLALTKKARANAENRAMLLSRRPEDAPDLMKSFGGTMKTALDDGNKSLRKALAAAQEVDDDGTDQS